MRTSFARRIVLLAFLSILAPLPAAAQTQPAPAAPDSLRATSATGSLPTLGILSQIQLVDGQEDFALPIQLLLLLTVLSLAPSIIILMTCFTRLVVVFGILRQALGTQQSPPTQVIIGLALFLTLFIMYPVFQTVHDRALQPYLAGEIGQREALDRAAVPMKQFMLAQTREKDLMLFMDLAAIGSFKDASEVPLHVLVPAFVISELRIAFQIGFMIFLPFLIVDLVVASVLMSMGMMMLPPVMISLPIKLLLFVLADGWYLIVESVIQGYNL
ncbi:MAG: flagellar biosynthetic protein FliP [Bacteroidetes bacterium]|nr:MAG: flagellar biosynthetic protein FliP [Bacteroidota bacterium]